MSIRIKSIISFGVVIFLFVLIVSYQNYNMKLQSSKLQELNQVTLQSALTAQELLQTLTDYQIQIMLPATGYSTQANIQPAVEDLLKKFNVFLNKYAVLNPQSSDQIEQIKTAYDAFINEGDTDSGERLSELMLELKQSHVRQINNNVQGMISENETRYRQSFYFQIGVVVAVIMLSLLFARSLTRPIQQLVTGATTISKGDLSQPMKLKSKDEMGKLASIFETMRSGLAQFIHSAQNTANTVAHSSQSLSDHMKKNTISIEKIKDSARRVSEGTQHQLKSAEETALAMEEVTRGITVITDSNAHAAHQATVAEREARRGKIFLEEVNLHIRSLSRTMVDVTSSVQTLEKHSITIHQIVLLIQSVAKQTNLLALNASIEAARSGEQGRGFAVVAQEIRTLADQTQNSLNHISEIVDNIQKDTATTVNVVEEGRNGVHQTERKLEMTRSIFEAITLSTKEMADQMQEVSSASEQISAGCEQVDASINELADTARMAHTESREMVSIVEEQIQIVQQVTDSTTSMQEVTLDLKGRISEYKV
ncbi:methyl-accepting chemotaxis protein [Paenibacillus sp. UASWS1643]|uniref:methyl-accepting chemotaxis protein n=1 Tax=Paenibacillus sp. UASWS1643 TaxID=2580422 RepID=UPI00123B40C2|nr:methyl-accepting chemotaxis protein [Paenibacillus sp. UASWS1643]KAA8746151.1 methyl-accepting chemotaxis protein [Paenibacillus sp. UASWS1643]